ncbi:MAG: Hsp20/alpha crystallin family protein [Bacteroidetes bacterium]|jgi:HSP20 family protein|nr:Hsp20/alpha crystallin family protein [Bacteroidota bacterium]MBP6402530.1 Hsp20/alpha crystallin family protein [Bacteroidia bacterium]MBK6837392.1 Hsp20/alpha crystallin family protein [Bacteroidota bacterium]MBK9523203.1 Hsp20/alpha crystallin family protein [Bacteroidota bacterium]MBK9540948.1 Hsp20/alpha crystallin family protein [Bacteroidota bacterium]
MTLIKRSLVDMPAYRSLLSDFFETENLGFDSLMKKDWLPPVNVLDTEKFYQIEVAAPGLKKEDFKVKIDDGILTISAEKKVEKEEKEKNYTRKEFNYSSFLRSFTLPENVMENDIKAQYMDGVLRLNLVKKAVIVSKAKEIAVM